MRISHICSDSQLINDTLTVVVIVFVMMCGGCGAPAPDEKPSSQISQTPDVRQRGQVRAPQRLLVVDPDVRENWIGRVTNKVEARHQLENRHELSTPSIPHPVLTDLASPQAGIRLRALDYWDTKDAEVPLDAVFEAMEDEDETVRARATAIIDQRWAAEEEKGRD